MNNGRIMLALFTSLLLLTSGCVSDNSQTKQKKETKTTEESAAKSYKMIQAKSQKIGQIQGIGFPGNDEGLYVATKDGLKLYKQSKWYETTTNRHNYTSFQAIEKGFLASGHPEKGSILKSQLGIVRSEDSGKNLTKLSYYGKKDFQYLSSSYSGSGIYMIDVQPKNENNPGVYYSLDQGKSWNRSKLDQFNASSLGMIAVHPKNGNTIAMATRSGIYYSENNGNTMALITPSVMVTALTFQGEELLYSSVENKQIQLKKVNPKSHDQSETSIPFLDYDNPITYIAVDPNNPEVIAFSTYKNDLYESIDNGKSWISLLADGKIEQE